ncbi:MAG TPA: zf-HC2 domain-containing protein [Gemmatimonadales bacterium]|nr:zf-HC2 domain-containing protein [Gemmatimonadales bacterium]
MSDQWTDRLSEYLDDEMAPGERRELEAHLLHCVACGSVLADLKRIVIRARGLEDRPPARDPWPGIAARIGVGGTGASPVARRLEAHPRRRWTFSVPQLAAASIALMTVSGGTAWLLHPVNGPGAVTVAAPPSSSAPQLSPSLVVPATSRTPARSYDAAVADLERLLGEGRGRLDTATVRVIERNLATIDSAIVQAQRAVAADSANVYLNSHLAETMRRKLELLRQAAALVSSVS